MKLSPEFQYLRPFKSELIRVGPKGDCGYVIPKSVAEKTNGMYSIGISTNWEFEVEMAKRNPKLKISAFDRTSGWTVFAFVGLRDLLRGDPSESEKMSAIARFKSALHYLNLSVRFRIFFSGRKKFDRKWVRESSSLKSEISFADSIQELFDKDEVTSNSNQETSFQSYSNDDEFYKEILRGIGAPVTKNNMTLFYAWRQAEGNGGKYNPFLFPQRWMLGLPIYSKPFIW